MANLDPEYTQDWSIFLAPSLSKLFPTPPTKPMKAVEIGSFEGRGTRTLFERLAAHHRDSRLYCVDPWQDVYVPGKTSKFGDIDQLFIGQYQRFLRNTRDLGTKIVPMKGMSDQVVPMIGDRLDFALIDGDHSPEQVYRDASMLLPLMRKGGVILFDDYPWIHNGVRCSEGIDR